MRVFDNFNNSSVCKICGTSNEGQAVLLPIDGTLDDGIEEAEQVHLDCIDLRLLNTPQKETRAIIYQQVF